MTRFLGVLVRIATLPEAIRIDRNRYTSTTRGMEARRILR